MDVLQILNYPGTEQELTHVLIHESPWFVAFQACNILELTDTSKSTEKLDEEDKLIRKIFVSGQNREVILINESGLYNLIFSSSKPEAKKFKRWITKEVLPQIRKTGMYVAPSAEIELIKSKTKRKREVTSYLINNVPEYQELLRLDWEIKQWNKNKKNTLTRRFNSLFDEPNVIEDETN